MGARNQGYWTGPKESTCFLEYECRLQRHSCYLSFIGNEQQDRFPVVSTLNLLQPLDSETIKWIDTESIKSVGFESNNSAAFDDRGCFKSCGLAGRKNRHVRASVRSSLFPVVLA